MEEEPRRVILRVDTEHLRPGNEPILRYLTSNKTGRLLFEPFFPEFTFRHLSKSFRKHFCLQKTVHAARKHFSFCLSLVAVYLTKLIYQNVSGMEQPGKLAMDESL